MRHEGTSLAKMDSGGAFKFALVWGPALLGAFCVLTGASSVAAEPISQVPRDRCSTCHARCKGSHNSTTPCEGGTSSAFRRHKRSCRGQTSDDHISNLIEEFIKEYAENNPGGTEPSRRRAVLWKFEQLDADGDRVLSRREARTAGPCVLAACDVNKDRRLARGEWLFCFVRRIVPDVSPEDLSRHESPAQTTERAPVTPSAGCTRTPLAAGFVPACASDGSFLPVQCHLATGYCWCVNTRTGRPRKGTTTLNAKPDCSALTPGCNGLDVPTMLDELRHQLSKKEPQSMELDDIFEHLDRNQDKSLELKREWVRVRWRKLKPRNGGRKLAKCWRGLGRKCDKNKDQKISLEEWSECTQSVAKRRNIIKRGPNPFSTILKSD